MYTHGHTSTGMSFTHSGNTLNVTQNKVISSFIVYYDNAFD